MQHLLVPQLSLFVARHRRLVFHGHATGFKELAEVDMVHNLAILVNDDSSNNGTGAIDLMHNHPHGVASWSIRDVHMVKSRNRLLAASPWGDTSGNI
jgi:hypothetical protein